MKRRDFVSILATAPLTAACGRSSLMGDNSDLKSEILLPKNPDAPTKLSGKSRSILVVGGGIAGLTSAYELAKRGYEVHLREASSIFGGRLHTRTERLSTGQFAVEHGLHMWFYQYYNFKRILSELDLTPNFRPFNEVYFHFNDYLPETVRSVGPYPANLISMIKDSPNLSLLNAIQTWRALPDIMFYNHLTTPKKLDQLTFPGWAEKTKVDKKFYDIIMYPAASVTLNDPKTMSAAEVALMTHFYFMSHPKAFHRTIAKYDHGTAVIDPWVSKVRSLGVELNLNSPVRQLDFMDGKVNADGRIYDRVIITADIPAAKKIVQAATASTPALSAPLNEIKKSFVHLKAAPPYHILRVWFDTPVGTSRPDVQSVIETPQSRPINLLAFMHKLEDESKRWAESTNGSIVEFHLYTTPQFVGKSADQIWSLIKSEAESILPELKGAKALDYSLGSYENFTSFDAGQLAFRPSAFSAMKLGIKSLLFAGDWVDYPDFPNSLMERSVTTGLDAVNSILYADQVRQIPVEGANTRGPGLIPMF